MRSANIHLPIPYFDEIRLNQAIELIDIVNNDAFQLKELLERKSETENSRWYREKLAKLFLSLSILSSLSLVGLNIATKFAPDSIKNTLSDISTYTGYGTIFVTIIGAFLHLSPDTIALSIKAFFKEFTPDEVEQLNNFAANLYRLQSNSKSAFYQDNIVELPSTFLYEISQQFQHLSSLSINTAKACVDKIPIITNNLHLLFSKIVREEKKSPLSISSDHVSREENSTPNDSDEYIEDDNENESLLSPRLVIRQT